MILHSVKFADIQIIRKEKKEQSPFVKSQHLQNRYTSILRSVSREVRRIIDGYVPRTQDMVHKLRSALRQYADILTPWAESVVGRVLQAVNAQDIFAWRKYVKNMRYNEKSRLFEAPIEETLRALMKDQVTLIRSMPLDAAQQVHDLVLENLVQGESANAIAQKILQIQNMQDYRAKLIARTEIARAASSLTQARAQYAGSEGYIWRILDNNARASHKEMNGRFVKWDEPPHLSDGFIAHAGRSPNCRCYPEPVIKD